MVDKTLLVSLSAMLTLFNLGLILADNNVCYPKEWEGKSSRILCMCSGSDRCGEIEVSFPEEKYQAYLYRSTKSGKRLVQEELDEDEKFTENPIAETVISVDIGNPRQTIMGWGGAFTDAFGENVMKLSEGLQRQLMESYFGKSGLQYNFGRVPIGGTDSSSRPYTYDDLEGDQKDFELKHWSLAKEDLEYKIPLILEAKNLTESCGAKLNLFATPWSPPGWMKDNKILVRGHLVNDKETYKAYADYLIKFYQAYKKHGIDFWGATVQNEPVDPNWRSDPSNSLQMSDREMIRFIADHLVPAFKQQGCTKDNFKLMVGDDSLKFIQEQVPQVLADPVVRDFVSGLAFHWYTTNTLVKPKSLSELMKDHGKILEFVMMTEASEGSSLMHKAVKPGSWDRAEKYFADITDGLNRGTNAWIDWNMALDMKGGPSWSRINADSPILTDHENNLFYKQPMYYALAHYTRFFRPGSVRLRLTGQDTILTALTKAAAVYYNETNHVAINVMNPSNLSKRIKINLFGAPKFMGTIRLATFVAEPNSMTSVVVKV